VLKLALKKVKRQKRGRERGENVSISIHKLYNLLFIAVTQKKKKM
jgi:hypothetical protein